MSRNKYLANLIISPVRYNPSSNKLEVITSMKIEISFSSSVILNQNLLSQNQSFYNESLAKGVLNYNPGM